MGSSISQTSFIFSLIVLTFTPEVFIIRIPKEKMIATAGLYATKAIIQPSDLRNQFFPHSVLVAEADKGKTPAINRRNTPRTISRHTWISPPMIESRPRTMIKNAPNTPVWDKNSVIFAASVDMPPDFSSSHDAYASAALVARSMAVTPAAATSTSLANDAPSSTRGWPRCCQIIIAAAIKIDNNAKIADTYCNRPCNHSTEALPLTSTGLTATIALAMKLKTDSVAVATAEATESTTDSPTAFTPSPSQPLVQHNGEIPHSLNDGILLLLSRIPTQ